MCAISIIILMERTRTVRNRIIMAAMLPVAFTANIVRVMVLVLVTYNLGDEAGQDFLHGFAGIMLFVIGLFVIGLFFYSCWTGCWALSSPTVRASSPGSEYFVRPKLTAQFITSQSP